MSINYFDLRNVTMSINISVDFNDSYTICSAAETCYKPGSVGIHGCFERNKPMSTIDGPLAQYAIINCFVGVGNYIAVFVKNEAFPRCGKTFFVNNSCEFDEYARKKQLFL